MDVANRPQNILPFRLGKLGFPALQPADGRVGPEQHVKGSEFGRLFQKSHLGRAEVIKTAADDDARDGHFLQS